MAKVLGTDPKIKTGLDAKYSLSLKGVKKLKSLLKKKKAKA